MWRATVICPGCGNRWQSNARQSSTTCKVCRLRFRSPELRDALRAEREATRPAGATVPAPRVAASPRTVAGRSAADSPPRRQPQRPPPATRPAVAAATTAEADEGIGLGTMAKTVAGVAAALADRSGAAPPSALQTAPATAAVPTASATPPPASAPRPAAPATAAPASPTGAPRRRIGPPCTYSSECSNDVTRALVWANPHRAAGEDRFPTCDEHAGWLVEQRGKRWGRPEGWLPIAASGNR